MKPPSEDHDLIRWLDGEMNAAECAAFEERLKNDPVLAKDAQEMRALSVGIREFLPKELPVPHADFFNSQIQVRIAQMDAQDSRSQSSAGAWAGLLQWFRQPWLAAAGAVALAIVAFTALRPGQEAGAGSLILSSYTPDASIHARTYHDDAANATVLMLDGLDAIPPERKVSGVSVSRSEMEPEMAATTLYDGRGLALLSISSNSAGRPIIW